jgi:epoxyqueuosine reductase
VAPFARAHYYRGAVDLLRRLVDRLERDAGVPRRSVRIFSNSRMPEKQLLAATGLAAVGKNGLCLVPGLGSMFTIAGIVLPVPASAVLPTAAPAGTEPVDLCGSCSRCLRACPVGALTAPGILDRDRCLQAWATRPDPFPVKVIESWGARLYGCQDCQSCCPHNAALSEGGPEAPGELGPSLPLLPFLAMDEAGLKRRLRGTALGMSWIAPASLVRNALAAAGAQGDPAVRHAIAAHVNSDVPALRTAARWALGRLRGLRP